MRTIARRRFMRAFVRCLRLTAFIALAWGAASPLRAATLIHKTLAPVAADTTYIHHYDLREYPSCRNLDILFRNPGTPAPGRIRVGFTYFSQSDTSCPPFDSWALRGRALFRTADVPHQFKRAILVLAAESVRGPSVDPPLRGLQEMAVRRQSDTFMEFADSSLDIGIQLDLENQSVTVMRRLDNFIVASADPAVQPVSAFINFPTDLLIDRPAPSSFRIDVSSFVLAWFIDWPHRDEFPLRGFNLIGVDETLPEDANRELLITYRATLEFEIEEPDR